MAANAAGGYLLGHLVADPASRHLGDGKLVTDFAVAIKKISGSGDGRKEYTSFFDVVAFGKTAEFVSKYLKKGSLVFVEYEPKQERWESEGVKRSRVKFYANSVQSIGGGNGN